MNRRRFLTLSAAFACSPALARADTWTGIALGAEVSVTLYGPPSQTGPMLAAIPRRLRQIDQPLRAVTIDLVGHLGPGAAARPGGKDHRVHAVADIGLQVGQVALTLIDALGQDRGIGPLAHQRNRLRPALQQFPNQQPTGFAGGPGD